MRFKILSYIYIFKLLVCVLFHTANCILEPDSPAFSLGGSLEFHTHSKNMSAESIRQLKQQAEKGNIESQYFLGLIYYYGVGEGAGYQEKNHAAAFTLFRLAGSQGHIHAMTAVGAMLLRGEGKAQDATAARAWFTKAAEKGDAEAMWLMGMSYFETRTDDEKSPDFSKAKQWFSQAAKLEHPPSLHNLGLMHEYGLGMEQSFARAAKFYTRAMNQDFQESRYHLALMHAYGRGFTLDYTRALELFKEGVRKGHAPSMLYLGKMFLFGFGVPVDYDMAVIWFEQAAKMNNSKIHNEAVQARDEILHLVVSAKAENRVVQEQYALKSTQQAHAGNIPTEYF